MHTMKPRPPKESQEGDIPLIYTTTFEPNKNAASFFRSAARAGQKLLTHSGMRPPWCAVKGNSSTNNRASKIEVRVGKNRHLEEATRPEDFLVSIS